MFIICQHCKATFKIDEQKIPSEKSFVKCSNCSKPIPLDPGTKDSETVVPKEQVVECDECHSRYMIPIEKIAHSSLKVRCGKCSNLFTVPSIYKGTPEEIIDDMPDLDAGDALDNVRMNQNITDDLGLDDLPLPDEDVSGTDDLFGLDEDENTALDTDDDIDLNISGFSSKPPLDATSEYLKSVSYEDEADDDSDLDSDLNMGTVSKDQKYKFFLKPKGKKEENKSIEEDLAEHWPEIQDETDDLETEIDLDLPDSAEDGAIDDEFAAGKSQKGKKIAAILFIILLFAVAGVLGWMLIEKKGGPNVLLQPFDMQSEKSKIFIQEPLNGRYITNNTTKKKIFVLQGAIKNLYASDVKISSVKVKGTLYNNKDIIIADAIVYAGNFLTDKQLQTFSQQRIKSSYLYQFGNKDVNLDLGVNQIIPFQVVFLKIPGKFHKLEAKIESFSKNTK